MQQPPNRGLLYLERQLPGSKISGSSVGFGSIPADQLPSIRRGAARRQGWVETPKPSSCAAAANGQFSQAPQPGRAKASGSVHDGV
jgi:hypothetical protein